MNNDFDVCPKCSKKVLTGAMRCMSCGTVLKSQEEQKAMIQHFMEQKRGFDNRAFLKLILFLSAMCGAYYIYSEEIRGFIKYLTE